MGNKLLIMSNSKGYGGADRSLELLLEKIALQADYELMVIVENDLHYQAIKKLILEQELIQMPSNNRLFTLLNNVKKLQTVIKKFKPDFILVNSNRAAIYLCLWKLLNLIPPETFQTFLFVRGFDWKFLKPITHLLNSARILCPSQAVPAKDNYLPTNSPVSVLANLVKLPNMEITSSNFTPHLTCLANVSRWKGLDYLIQAYAQIPVNPYKLKIFGSVFPGQEGYYQELINLCKNLGVLEQIEFCPFQSEQALIYKNSLIVINSSISAYGGPETFGRTIIEAWSFKKPVVSFEVGGPKYLIEHGQDGFLVPEKNTSDLANKLQYLINNPSVRDQMGQNGSEHGSRI